MNFQTASYPVIWLRGIPADFWLKHSRVVEEYVKAAKLQALDQTHLVTKLEVLAPRASQQAATAATRAKILPQDIRGGIRVAHLHLKDQIYLLTDTQWKEFSGRMMKDFSAKISNASSVSFDQLLDLSEAIDTIHV